MTQLRASLNDANPNILPSALQQVGCGTAMMAGPQTVQGAVTANNLPLPFPAVAVVQAFALAGSVTGPMAGVDEGVTLATKQCKIGPNGQSVVFFGTDAVTSAQVVVIGAEGLPITIEVPVVSNVATIPGGKAGMRLLSVSATAAGSPGAKTVVARAAAPSAGQASLNLLGTGIAFNSGDTVTRCQATLLVVPGIGDAPASIAQRLLAEFVI